MSEKKNFVIVPESDRPDKMKMRNGRESQKHSMGGYFVVKETHVKFFCNKSDIRATFYSDL